MHLPTLNVRFFISSALLLTASFLLLAPSARAGDDLPPTSQFFDEYDQNADGTVTAEEFRGASAIFRLIDKNGDGVIKPAELGLPVDYKPDPKAQRRRAGGEAAGRGGKRAGGKRAGGKRAGGKGANGKGAEMRERMLKRLKAMDTNGDGRVTRDEWKGPEKAFDRFDRNKDGAIDAKDAKRGRGRDGKGRGGKDRGKGREGKPRDGAGRDPAMAERMKARAKQHFASLDKNDDGKLTADEAPNPKLIEIADGNGDGSVTLEEFLGFMKKRARDAGDEARRGDGAKRGPGAAGKAGKGRRRGRISTGMLRRWDRDGDGKVSPEEFPGRDEMFQRLDADKDGALTEADVKAAREQPSDRPGADRPRTNRSGDRPAQTGNVIEQQDTDGDGKLTRAEFKGTNEIWRLLDRNGDGWITADELKPAAKKPAAEKPEGDK